MYIACLCPNLVSVHFYAIPILHFKFPKFFIYLYIYMYTYVYMSPGKLMVVGLSPPKAGNFSLKNVALPFCYVVVVVALLSSASLGVIVHVHVSEY